MKGIKDMLIESWLVSSTAVWIMVLIGLYLLPISVWHWFNMIPILILVTLNLCFSLNVYLNRQRRKEIK